MTPTPSPLRDLLGEPGGFARIVELVPARGLLASRDRNGGGTPPRLVAQARELAESGVADALSITDNAGGHPTLAPEALGLLLRDQGQEVIIHLSCKDLSRNGLESRAWALATDGLHNLLCVSGDYPVDGYHGRAAPVFDIDSVALLEMVGDMNRGLRVQSSAKGKRSSLPATRFFPGAVVSPFKQHERELLPQYFKLARKVAAGAEFIITQVGYDMRKLDELARYVALKGLEVALIANVGVLTAASARFFHRGAVPGVVVTEALLALAEQHAAAPDKGKAFFHDLAARQVAVARGLGYRGAYLSGHLKPEECQAIFARADAFGPDEWRIFAREIEFAQPGEFYYFEHDPQSGLSAGAINRAYLASCTPRARRALRRQAPLTYKLNRCAHDWVFAPGSPGFAAGRRFYARMEGLPSPGALGWLHTAEQALKIPLYGCRDCGDCSLPDVAYLCPESQCAKNQRNGPCGGSHQGLCEVKNRPCIWARAYERLKAYGEEERMLDRPVVIKDNTLKGTSAWANTFLERDHAAAADDAV